MKKLDESLVKRIQKIQKITNIHLLTFELAFKRASAL